LCYISVCAVNFSDVGIYCDRFDEFSEEKSSESEPEKFDEPSDGISEESLDDDAEAERAERRILELFGNP